MSGLARVRIQTMVCAATLLTACGPGMYSATATGPKRPSKAPPCEFQIAATVPAEGYVELGVLDWTTGMKACPTTMNEFKDMVAEPTCKLGGELVVSQVNGGGVYIRALVLAKAE